MKQTLLKISLPRGSTLYPGRLRTLVAALGHRAPELFARDALGRTVVYPGIRFVGGGGWVGLLADELHEDVLMRHIGDVLMAASKEVGQACPVEVEHHDCQLIAGQRPYNYYAGRIALKRRHLKARTADIAELLTERIYQALDRTCAQFGMDCPDIDSLGVMNVDVQRSIGMPLETSAGESREYVSLVDASFTLHAELKGLWFVGNLTARGHGRVVTPYGIKGGSL
jgi:hypothetical protein